MLRTGRKGRLGVIFITIPAIGPIIFCSHFEICQEDAVLAADSCSVPCARNFSFAAFEDQRGYRARPNFLLINDGQPTKLSIFLYTLKIHIIREPRNKQHLGF